MNKLLRAFQTLNVEPGCDDIVLRRAWRALVRTYHPDMARSDPARANARLAEINAAWDLICSCTAEDVQRAKDMVAQRHRAAERRHRDEEARQNRPRAAAFEAGQPRPKAEMRRENADKCQTGAPTQARAEQTKPDRTGKMEEANGRAPEQILSFARRAFQAAQVACSADVSSGARPFYM